ncbi:MAG: hypothetical protein NZ580_01130 [Bacteroidia bacterium]|nr:hypothetical protein [Bacteroidia bacterium]MDW8235510.1 hypothetical protein [Bacteroidia bacterium]
MSEIRWDWQGFWKPLPSREKKLFLIPLVFLIGGTIWAATGWWSRYDFSEALVPLFFEEEQIHKVAEASIRHRTYVVELPLRRVYEMRVADLLIPPSWAIVAGWVLSVIGWGALLAGTTRMQGLFSYLVAFAWAAWVHIGGTPEAWAGTNPLYIVSLGLALSALLPTYAVQAGWWRLSLGWSCLIFSLLVGIVLGLPASWKGRVVLHDSLTFPGMLTLALSGIAGLQAPIAITAIGVYLLSRRKARLFSYLGLVLGLAGIAVFLWIGPEEATFTVAIALLLIAVLLSLIGLQPFYPLWAENFRQPSGFFWAWTGLSLITVGGLGYHAWNHQDLFIYRVANLLRGMGMGGMVGIGIYLIANFWVVLRRGLMSYWDLARSTRFPLAGVYFISIATFIGWESHHNWPTARFPARLHAILRPESALVAGDWEIAQKLYEEALIFLPYEAKANYNLARLEAQKTEEAQNASERYQRAILSKPFLPAAIQGALVWMALDRPVLAIQSLQHYIRRFGSHPEAANLLAFLFQKIGVLDSAVFYWKEAIRAAPKETRYALHLALLYATQGQAAWATKIVFSLKKPDNPSLSTEENIAYLWWIRALDSLPFPVRRGWNVQWLGQTQDTTLLSGILRLLHRNRSGEAALSLEALAQQQPDLAPFVARLVGIALLRDGLVRRAADLFSLDTTAYNRLYACYALAESGCIDTALALLSYLSVYHPEIKPLAEKETALLLAAKGYLPKSPVQWNDDDYLRVGYYAFAQGNLPALVAALYPWIEKGAKYDEPYELAARLILRKGDTLVAYENIQAGRKQVPNSLHLSLLEGEILHSQGKTSEAQRLVDSLLRHLRTREDSLLWFSLKLRLQKDKSLADAILKHFPNHSEAQVVVADSLMDKGLWSQAHEFLSQAIAVNPYDSVLWRAYARVYEGMGMSKEAAYARMQPVVCPSAP